MKGVARPADDLFAVLPQKVENETQAPIIFTFTQGLAEQFARPRGEKCF